VGLTDDQKAMLRLLAQREEGYDDMAALMGISVEEVRERVKEALAEVEEPEAGGASPSEPSPSAAAPATPVEPEPVVEEPTAAQKPAEPSAGGSSSAAASDAKDEAETKVADPSAQAETAESAVPPAGAPVPPPARGKRPSQLPRLKVPKDRGALIGLGAGALVVLVFAIVLIVAGGGGGGSDSSTTASTPEGGQAETANAAAEEEGLTEAVLSPTDGGEASGRALFGRYKKNVLLQVEAEGLDPSPQGKAYAVWLYRSPKLALQIGAVQVGQSGKIGAQFQIPPQLLAYVASGAFNQVDVSLISTAAYKAAFTKAKSENKLPPYSGESVLRGEITGPAIRSQQ
jgi:hypothetical protein